MAFFKGAAKEAQRAMQLQKQREKDKKELELAKLRLESEMRIGEIKNKFASNTEANSFTDQSVGVGTVGLVTLDEMQRQQERVKRNRLEQEAADAAAADDGGEPAAKRRAQDEANCRRGALSFDFEDEEEEDKQKEKAEDKEKEEEGRKKFGKDPTIDTSFLPDIEREEKERQLREQLKQEWLQQQEQLKSEEMEIVFSYWDGSGHRRSQIVTKGTTVAQFLRKALEQLRKEFQELRSIAEDQLMFVKEDTILPHHLSFYDLIVAKARGKSGPLHLFDVKEDVRLSVDTMRPSQETHAGKICLRNWYNRNKHIFPASRWEPYDPTKDWDMLPASMKTANVINVK